MTNLSDRLRSARKAAQLTQTDLAKAVGVTPQAIQQLESGVTKTSRHLFHLALRLGVTPKWLETGIGTPKPTKKDERDISKIYREGFHGWQAKIMQMQLKFPPDRLSYFLERMPFEMTFPSDTAPFRANEAPVFLCSVPGMGRPEGTEAYFELTDHLSVDMFVDVIGFDLDQVGGFLEYMFHCFLKQEVEAWLPRPHYLAGVIQSYSVFAVDSFFMQISPPRWRTFHLNPHRTPYVGDDVFVYHHSNAFLYGRLVKGNEHTITLRFDGIRNIYNDVVIVRSAVKAIHVVVGTELDAPPQALSKAVLMDRPAIPHPDDLPTAEAQSSTLIEDFQQHDPSSEPTE